MKIQPLMALVVLSLPTVPGARAAVRGFKARTLALLTLACLLVAAPATAHVNYEIYDGTAYVTSSPNASGDIVIASTYNGYPVTRIRFFAFSGCTNLTSVTIPNSVTTIDQEPFIGCTSLTNLSVDAANPAYSSLNGVLFDKAQTTLITYPAARVGGYVIPGSVTSIPNYAFRNCTRLASVTIGNSVTNIGSGAFSGCTNLTSVTIPDSVTGIGYQAFSGCAGLTNVIIGNSVTSIGGTFSGCAHLTSVTIPASVTFIGGDAFNGCASLTNLSVDAANPVYSSPDGVLFDKAQTTLIMFPPGRGSYVMPDSVTRIGTSLYSGGYGLAFYGCTGLTNVIIGHSVTNIGYVAFALCTNLTRVTIPASVMNIGAVAFSRCLSLTNVTFLGNPPRLVFDIEAGGAHFQGVGAGAKAYYYCGTTGWGATYGGLPTVLLCPPQVAPGSAGLKPGGFGFTVTRLTNQTVVVEASTNLVNWQPIWTNPPPGASTNFIDPEWLNHSNRFYRARSD